MTKMLVIFNHSLTPAQRADAAARALREKFRDWGCDKKNAQGDKNEHWKNLQIRLKKLKAAS